MADHILQRENTRVGLEQVLRHQAFIEGYISFAKGLPFNRNVLRTADEEWHYVRGRQVACLGKERFRHVRSLWSGEAGGSVVNPKVIDLAGSMIVDFS